MVLISNALIAQPVITLQKATKLPFFQSITALEYFDRSIMAIGNDATRIFMLNENHDVLDSLSLFEYPQQLNKPLGHAGIQATAIVTVANNPALLIMGSGEQRTDKSDIWLFPLRGKSYSELYTPALSIADFFKRIKRMGIDNIAIEGAAEVKGNIVLANAASANSKKNHLILTEFDFWEKGAITNIIVSELQLPAGKDIRVTGLEFDAKEDLLMFSASSINNSNSFVGIIQKASKKLQQPAISVNYLLSLQEKIPELEGKKLQSICLGKTNNPGEIILHVCAIDSQKQCYVYRLSMKQ
jgi:hypothetical protein